MDVALTRRCSSATTRSARSGSRTVEIGNTHEKLVLTEGRTAIVTSFNWLSFKPTPGRGLRRETGLRVDEVSAVVALRASLADALGLPAKG